MSALKEILSESIRLREIMLNDAEFEAKFNATADVLLKCFRANGKLLLCGNGGSAADAQHIAAELSGRFKLNRAPLFAEALHVNSSFVTAVANDYGFDQVYARMVQAMGKKGDVLIAISTSGNSLNVLNAVNMANELGMVSIALLGEKNGKIGDVSQLNLNVPSADTARIQEVHITLGHALCEVIETNMFA